MQNLRLILGLFLLAAYVAFVNKSTCERIRFTALRARLNQTGAGAALASLVDNNISLTDLDLSDNHLGGQQARYVFCAVSQSKVCEAVI